jgi:sporadic carbohydrate cluster 2OG-Fe(II) oxygenase
MSLTKQVIRSLGYSITKIPNMKKFNQLRDKFIEKMGLEKKSGDINRIRKDIALMNNAEVNKAMINLLSFDEASEMMIDACSDIVKELSGSEILIQRRANNIFNLPGKNQRRQWPHYELMSGISPYTFVLWAPFHDLQDDAGVYYIDQEESFKLIKKEHDEGLVNGPTILNMMHNQKPAKLRYGEVIVFNPFILHGNIDFNSDLARVACSVRFQNKNKPLMQKNSDFLKIYQLN